jgi:hypothetical protein
MNPRARGRAACLRPGGTQVADEIPFQNDPVDPSVEFRKQHEVLWKRMSLAQRVSYHQVTLQLDWDGAREWRPAG